MIRCEIGEIFLLVEILDGFDVRVLNSGGVGVFVECSVGWVVVCYVWFVVVKVLVVVFSGFLFG